ncbi:hypothetical protein M3Y99_01604500 [Aphelenchoides fujianensis]|nr:hypothetical protein M3Y99_01604500 [Aphelenchoides fujianensis]
MSRANNLTCDESLPDDGSGGGSNFSPLASNRTYMSQGQQLFNPSTADSLAALRERIAAQQQPTSQQHAPNPTLQHLQQNPAVAQLLSQQGAGLSVEALASQLAPANALDANILSQLQFLQNRQRVQSQQQQLLENLPSTAQLTAALLAQQNWYGALPQLAPGLSALNGAGLSANLPLDQSRLNVVQQAASLLGININPPQQPGYSTDTFDLSRATNQILQQLAQAQQQQQLQSIQTSAAAASYLNDPALQQQAAQQSSAVSTPQQQQQLLLSNALYNARNQVASTSAASQTPHGLSQQQISDFLSSQQAQIPTSQQFFHQQQPQLQLGQARSQAEHLAAQTSSAYGSLNGGQLNAEQPQMAQLLQQCVQRLNSSYAQTPAGQKEKELLAAQLLQLGYNDAGRQLNLSPFQPSTSQQGPSRGPVISAAQQHGLQLQQQALQQQMANALQNEGLHLRMQQEMQQTAKFAQHSPSLQNNLNASQVAFSQAAAVDQRASATPSKLLSRTRPTSSGGAPTQTIQEAMTRQMGRPMLPDELLALEAARTAGLDLSSLQAALNLQGGGHDEPLAELLLRQHAIERQRREAEYLEQTMKRPPTTEQLDQVRESGSSQKTPVLSDHTPAGADDARIVPNIPTLAAFRQVPGQAIFVDGSKKRMKQEHSIDSAEADGNEAHRKKNSADIQLLTSKSKKELQKQIRSAQKNAESATRDLAASNAQSEAAVPRKRGRPRTNFPKEKKLSAKAAKAAAKENDAASRTILHDAVDIFLKPDAPGDVSSSSAVSPPVVRKKPGRKPKKALEKQGEVVPTTSTSTITLDDDGGSADEGEPQPKKAKKKSKASERAALLSADLLTPREEDERLAETMKQLDAVPSLWDYSLSNGGKAGPLPFEADILDHVCSKTHLDQLAKVDAKAQRFNKKHEGPNGAAFDPSDVRDLQHMALQIGFVDRRLQFAKRFIYESTLLRVMNEEYWKLRGDNGPRELFLDNKLAFERADKRFTQEMPLNSRNMNEAEVECKLMDQMYRYRAQFFQQLHNRPFAPAPKPDLSTDEQFILNIDVHKTVSNLVDAVVAKKDLQTFLDESKKSLAKESQWTPDGKKPDGGEQRAENGVVRSPFDSTEERQLVIIKARDKKDELESLKKRLHDHLQSNFTEMLNLHDEVYQIRKKAINYHKDDPAYQLKSVRRLLSTNRGRRCGSVEPPMLPTDDVPVYRRRRCRSHDLDNEHRVVSQVGVEFIPWPVPRSERSALQPTASTSAANAGPSSSNDSTDAYQKWAADGFKNLAERFEALIVERKKIIAALVKLTMSDRSDHEILVAAREPQVAVNVPAFRVHGASSRRSLFKQSAKLKGIARHFPGCIRPPLGAKSKAKTPLPNVRTKDVVSWYDLITQHLQGGSITRDGEESRLHALVGNGGPRTAEQEAALRKEALKSFQKALKNARKASNSSFVAVKKEKHHLLRVLDDRICQNELAHRHAKCVALNVCALSDPERHQKFVEKLEKLEAPRMDRLMQMRNDLTTGYLFELPQYEMTGRAKKSNEQDNIKVAPSPALFDGLFGGKDKNMYRNPFLFPVTTPQAEIETAPLIKYRSRDVDATPAENLSQHMNLTTCAHALMRLVHSSPEMSVALGGFTNNPAFEIFNTETGDANGFPMSLYQLSTKRALSERKPPVEEREMPDFKNDEEAEAYFRQRARGSIEGMASLLTVNHKRTVLSRRCGVTMQKLAGVERENKKTIDELREHYNSLSSRNKDNMLRRYRVARYNQATRFDEDVPLEQNLNAPLPVPGFDPPDMHRGPENWADTPHFVRNEVLQPPKPPPVVVEEKQPATRGRGGARGARGGGRGRKRGGKN